MKTDFGPAHLQTIKSIFNNALSELVALPWRHTHIYVVQVPLSLLYRYCSQRLQWLMLTMYQRTRRSHEGFGVVYNRTLSFPDLWRLRMPEMRGP